MVLLLPVAEQVVVPWVGVRVRESRRQRPIQARGPPEHVRPLRRALLESRAIQDPLYHTIDWRPHFCAQGKRFIPVPFILTAVKPCALRLSAPATTSDGLSPPIHPYTAARSRTLPPRREYIGTPSFLPLMSQSAMSRPDRAD